MDDFRNDFRLFYFVVRISDGTQVHSLPFRNAVDAARRLRIGTTFGLGLTPEGALHEARVAAARVREFCPDYR